MKVIWILIGVLFSTHLFAAEVISMRSLQDSHTRMNSVKGLFSASEGILLKVKVPTGIENRYLPYVFHKEIYKYLLNMRDQNPLLKTAEIIGFETVDSDLLLDYQISIGKG